MKSGRGDEGDGWWWNNRKEMRTVLFYGWQNSGGPELSPLFVKWMVRQSEHTEIIRGLDTGPLLLARMVVVIKLEMISR